MSEYDDSRLGSGGGSRSGPEFDGGTGDLGGAGPIEEQVRSAMHAEGDAVQPSDRLAAITAQAGDQTSGRRGGWLWPVATAAAVALIAGVAWVGLRPGQSGPAPVATATATATGSSPAPSSSATTSQATPATGTTTSAPPVAPTGGLPVYFLTPQPGRPADWRLVRQFRQVALPAIADQGQTRIGASLKMALSPPDDPNGFVSAFPTGTTAQVTEVSASDVTLLLSNAGRTGLTQAQQRAAVQQVVWSATAALGRNVPVGIVIASGGNVFESVPAGVYKREPTETAYTVLAPIWVDTPGPGTTAKAPVTVKGQACVFEAALSWTLTAGGAQVAAGHAQAASGCPTQGAWSVDLGVLKAGSYRFTVQAFSAENGTVNAQNIVDFTVP